MSLDIISVSMRYKNLSNTLCVGLFILYLLHTMQPIAPYIEYVVEYDYISTTLCENKDKPEVKCKGKCHLYKQVKIAQDKKDKQDACYEDWDKNPKWITETESSTSLVSKIDIERKQYLYHDSKDTESAPPRKPPPKC